MRMRLSQRRLAGGSADLARVSDTIWMRLRQILERCPSSNVNKVASFLQWQCFHKNGLKSASILVTGEEYSEPRANASEKLAKQCCVQIATMAAYLGAGASAGLRLSTPRNCGLHWASAPNSEPHLDPVEPRSVAGAALKFIPWSPAPGAQAVEPNCLLRSDRAKTRPDVSCIIFGSEDSTVSADSHRVETCALTEILMCLLRDKQLLVCSSRFVLR
jgi:hypothetical protein